MYRPLLKDFQPTYRGKPVESAPDLKPEEVVSLSIMCQSFFGSQKGDFALDLDHIAWIID